MLEGIRLNPGEISPQLIRSSSHLDRNRNVHKCVRRKFPDWSDVAAPNHKIIQAPAKFYV